jgi:hypothetical protein
MVDAHERLVTAVAEKNRAEVQGGQKNREQLLSGFGSKRSDASDSQAATAICESEA